MDEQVVDIGRWRLLPRSRTLMDGERRQSLGARTTDLLLALIRARGEVVSQQQLMAAAWPGRGVVEQANLTVQISALRKAFGDSGAAMIITVPGRGYRFGGTLPRPDSVPAAPGALASVGIGQGPSLVVLPFRMLGGDADQTFFADGLVEDLITALSRVRWFTVIARASAFALRDRDLTPMAIGRELSVRYMISGAVRRANGRVRVNVGLIRTADGREVWSDRFDGADADIFALQDQIVTRIVSAIEPNLRRSEIEEVRRRPTDRRDAYEAYLRAIWRMHPMTRENCEAALDWLNQAIALDPTFPLALAAAGWCRMWQVSQIFPNPEKNAAEAIRLAEAALDHGADEPTVLAQVGIVFAYLEHRRTTALELVERAVALHPNSALTRAAAGWVQLYSDRPERALDHFDEAIRLDPIDPGAGEPMTGISYAHLMLGQLNEAVSWAERAVAHSDDRLSAWRALVAALGAAGQPAQEALAALLVRDPTFSIARFVQFNARRAGKRVIQAVVEGFGRAGVPQGDSGPTDAAR
ncbi:MAG: winged helix-turn-helix domain-containing protein [Alphaproteobacteria bacterium]|nr:winged helix-turn-helix domain-containing protein [Alphaproteobacteria bacterium]MCW5741013.1 winged helix-turn-helix domain-containing protein [Alphaproteobacteria bacterium]